LYKIPANTLFVGKNLIYVPICHSTNTLAAELGNKTPLPEGTLVITDNQQKGRGQRGNGWEAEPHKNFTLSVLLKPTFLAIANQFFLNQCISLAITDFINSVLNKESKIKWPNDIFIGDKKVGGILIENSLSGESIQQSIVGIGLNVNQQLFNNNNATSLSIISKNEFSLSRILEGLLTSIEARYLQLKRADFTALQSDYLQLLYRINEIHRFRDSENEFEGTITGIDERGRLKISAKTERLFDIKEVKFITD
jgi:BirA family biotin operon repressor/biotin-[acetyl-CoA-carboxylase] ligase